MHAVILASLGMWGAGDASAGLFRAYLSVNGSDANACTLPSPCRLLPAALAAINDGGEIWILDSADYNTATVNVNKSVTILAVPGALGSVVANGDAISINAVGAKVTLRNLVIPNLNGSLNIGVRFAHGSQLTVEGCEIYGTLHGIYVTAAGGLLTVKGTTIRDTTDMGVGLIGAVVASLKDVALLNLVGPGIYLLDGARAQVTDSVISGSYYGAYVAATGGTTSRLALSATHLWGNLTGVKVATASGGDTAQVVLDNVTITHTGTGVNLNSLGPGTKTVFTRQNNTLMFNTNDVTFGTLTPQAAF